MQKLKIFMLLTTFVVSACSTMSTNELVSKRNELNTMAEKAIAGLVAKDPILQSKIDSSLAYGVASMKLTKVPIIGGGGGEGVLIVKKGDQRVYFSVGRFDIGGGWGARSYKVLLIIQSQEVLDQWIDGKWIFESGAEASAGTAAAEASTAAMDAGFTTHVLAEGGASATATARIIHVKVNSDLTE